VIYCRYMQSGIVTCSLEIQTIGADQIRVVSITYHKLVLFQIYLLNTRYFRMDGFMFMADIQGLEVKI